MTPCALCRRRSVGALTRAQGNSFSSFQSSLADSSRRAARAFGLSGGVRTWRLIGYCVGALLGLWFMWRVLRWWRT
jgi:hypothetical protein